MPKDYCGVFGIAGHESAAALTRQGLYALQHRGQESAGIFVRTDGKCELEKGMGLVGDVFQKLPNSWWEAKQDMAIGHVRYSTAGGSDLVNAQPFAVTFDTWQLGLAHNGTISNAEILRGRLGTLGSLFQGSTDTELILHLAARDHFEGQPPWEALKMALRQCEGAYSIVALCEAGMVVARDPYGFRPLCIGKLGDTHVFASETSAFDMFGAEYVRDVEPGEFIVVDNDGHMHSSMIASAPRRAHCMFELVYFARPDSIIFGEEVYRVRKNFGARMAEESPVEADVVMPLPDGGTYAALGYADATGIPYDQGIMRNHYVGRTFIQPNAADRRASVKVKLNPVRSAIKGKRIVLVDDSIVRGNTSRERVKLLREFGAKEVHMRISCPPHIGGCFYGIDFPDPAALIATQYTIEEIAEQINVDSLAYLSLEGMLSCVERTEPKDYCVACFNNT
ncbi:amidophosphoribosyltransferase [bacterium F16]|nr:amidophosphoribosyltransferase [bacterium F16]